MSGRKGKYSEWLEPNNLILLQGWKRSGLSDGEISANMGISKRTYYLWREKYKDINKATTLGREQANYFIENKLFKKASEGNMTAIIFWLKNNWRDKYSDTQRTALEEDLTRAQIKKVFADTEIAKARAEMLRGSDEDTTNAIGQFVDMLLEAGKETAQNEAEAEPE